MNDTGLHAVVPPGTTCPRCASTALDVTLDASRNEDVALWLAWKARDRWLSVVNAVAILATLGTWSIFWLPWMLLMLGPRQIVKRAAIAAVPFCTRFHCRACALDWYADERATLSQQLGTGA